MTGRHRIEIEFDADIAEAEFLAVWIGSAIEGRFLADVREVSLTPFIPTP